MAKGWNVSPWVYVGADNVDRQVRVEVHYDTTTLAIIAPGLTGNRDPGCLFDQVQFGRPDDGTIRTFTIPGGDFSVSRQLLANQGFDTIQQIADANVTLRTA